jgi:hypothetical protein
MLKRGFPLLKQGEATYSTAFLFGDFGALLAGFGQTNGYGLFLALYGATLATLSRLEGAALFPMHRTLDAFARGLSVFCHARRFPPELSSRLKVDALSYLTEQGIRIAFFFLDRFQDDDIFVETENFGPTA